MEKENKVLIGIILIIILASSILAYLIFFQYDYNCLEEKALILCNERGVYYDLVLKSVKPVMSCKIDLRLTDEDAIKLNFLDSELEDCEK